jgi:hypothetical protein
VSPTASSGDRYGWTVVSCETELLLAFGSVEVVLTVALRTIEKPPGEGAFHTSVMSGADVFAGRLVDRVHVTLVPLGAGHTQPELTSLKNEPLAGSVITTLSPVASCGPAFETLTV